MKRSKLIFRDTFACNCNEGFTGDGTACTALQNECELNTHTCHEDAFCGDTDEGFSCTCNEGFTGDGFSGVDNTGRAHFHIFLNIKMKNRYENFLMNPFYRLYTGRRR